MQYDTTKVKSIPEDKILQKTEEEFYMEYTHQFLECSINFGLSRKSKYVGRMIFDLLIASNLEFRGQMLRIPSMIALVYGFEMDKALGRESSIEHEKFVEKLILNNKLQEFMNEFQGKRMGKNIIESHQCFLNELMKVDTALDLLETFNSKEIIGVHCQNFVEGVQAIIDLALTHPQFSKFTCSQIFLGCVETLMEINMPSNEYVKVKMGITWPTGSLQGKQMKKYLLENINDEEQE